MTDVLPLPALVMTVGAGLFGAAVHMPVPSACRSADEFRQVMVSGPASGLAETMTAAVSEQPPFVQMKLYVPTVLNAVIVVVGELGVVILAVPGLPACAVHVPDPVAAMVAVLLVG